MNASGPKSPCKVCGRDTDADCRWTDDLILCHEGSRFAPPAHLRPGETITIDGRPWALIRRGGGFSGQAAVFRPHREGFKPTGNHNADLESKARRSVVLFSIERFLEHFNECWNVLDFQTLTAAEFKAAKQLIDNTTEEGHTLARSLQSTWRQHPDLADSYRWRVESCLKNLKAQRDDADFFSRHYLGEVEL